jgi:hypothetical protein
MIKFNNQVSFERENNSSESSQNSNLINSVNHSLKLIKFNKLLICSSFKLIFPKPLIIQALIFSSFKTCFILSKSRKS